MRDAQAGDVPALVAIKGEGSEAVHHDRLCDAQGFGFRYLVLLVDQEVIGFACLVKVRPAYWSDGEDTQYLPHIVDLVVRETLRGQGYGSEFMRLIERIAKADGHDQLFTSVEPEDNPGAYALYQRLGYRQIQTEPYLKVWEFIDSGGKAHHGEDWVVDMVKQL